MSVAGLNFRHITKRYGPVVALDRFSLDVAPGEFMTFLGPSGSGKTTALNILAGFTSATEGDVLIGDRSVVDLPPEKRNVGMVFQSYSLFPHLTVFENVAFPLRLRGASADTIKQKVGSVLDMVKLADFGGRMPNELSGGQRQRVAFARAVVFDPPVLLMDEPLGALDLKLREQMQLEIKRFHAEIGCTIIFVTHDQGEALTLSDRVAVMRDGRIAQVGSPQDIYDRPESQYVAEFIGRTNLFQLRRGQGGTWDIPDLAAAVSGIAEANLSQAALSVRPEKIRPVPAGAQADQIAFDAKISDVVFQGDHVQYEAVAQGGKTLIFQDHRGPGSELLPKGLAVRLGFSASDAVPVERETA
ncbi:ABC transporter ATP-binding protein [Arenibacterium halophilum]|uniref:ABC transporter ATP-binding protein n=1 Tax=Arenibacterium halophilum TaxID=2583821 RepID=A0ABY2WZE2_9RHOB|nr:ABC transporter ATP-binding protein [Arenibacterium halophilum]TMV08318.1 ABC transporter ATP-binding protein [Arenibacterium halophilum]